MSVFITFDIVGYMDARETVNGWKPNADSDFAVFKRNGDKSWNARHVPSGLAINKLFADLERRSRDKMLAKLARIETEQPAACALISTLGWNEQPNRDGPYGDALALIIEAAKQA